MSFSTDFAFISNELDLVDEFVKIQQGETDFPANYFFDVRYSLKRIRPEGYESTLSFLGLGMPAPQPEWGQMLSEAREFMRKAPHLMAFPALSIIVTACSVNLIGDGLRDALDPHLKS